ncbi:hypothetical protein KY389_09105 [Paracoccus bogoriensis]|uniref:hypothetical protein n=1 Tax=Paracoccus bogoriensis TaxID=242065 RepID=UPI001CA5D2E2|nr:hypothetical protein [Paracoccus bogoriensis]MBW7056851.1 hypothetical protein [Paracoccus bogoriensis]
MQNQTTPAASDPMPDPLPHLMRAEAEGLAIACALDGVSPDDLAAPGVRPVALADLLAGTGPGVILLHPPAVALARALGESAPEAALAGWVKATRALLAAYRPRRAQLTLLDVARIGDAVVAAYLGLPLRRLPLRMPHVPAAALLAAGRLIEADAGARALAHELEAAMIAAPAPDPAWLAAQTCAMIEELTLLRALNAAQDAEIERLGRARLADELARRDAPPPKPAVDPAQSKALAQRVAELEGKLAEASRSRTTPVVDPARLEALAQRVTELEHELAAVYRSRSWRITAPLRNARRALGF